MFHLQLAIRHCLLDVGQPLLQTGPEDETPTADQLRRRFYLSHRNFRSAVAMVWVAVAVRHWILAGLFLRCFGMERLEWSMFQRLFPVFRRVAGVRIGLISILHCAAVPVPAEAQFPADVLGKRVANCLRAASCRASPPGSLSGRVAWTIDHATRN